MVKQLHGPAVDINKADVFTMMNEHSYAAFVGILSNIFMKAHASSSFRDGPYQAVLVVSGSMMQPYLNQPESSFERLTTIVERMKQPNNGIELGIFLSDDGMFSKNAKIGLKHNVSQCWPIVNSETVNKDIITINVPHAKLNTRENKLRYFQFEQIKGAIDNTPYIPLNYDTTIEQIFSSLEKSKCHICYQGGTAWLSISMGIPTIIVHPQSTVDELHLKFKMFGQDLGNINILNNQGTIDHVRKHPAEHHINIKDLKNTIRKFT